MPRSPRLEEPEVPLHVIQRGNNRAACFFGDVDRRFYLKSLAEAATRRGAAIHAYVLMTNHVHLLATPAQPGAVALMLQDLGRKYVRVINTIHERTGTLWEGRYRSSLVADERYLMACHRYIELNPVRAGIVDDPADYPWSSHAHYALGRTDSMITEHPAYLALGMSPEDRRRAFRLLFHETLEEATLTHIRDAANAGSALGTEVRKRGRPRKKKNVNSPDELQSGNLF